MKTGIELITEERLRQIEKEGWSEKHDDSHYCGELAMAASCYAANAGKITASRVFDNDGDYKKISKAGIGWPFHKMWWKPKSPISDLVKAGALIAAEIDRLHRNK